MTDSLWRKRQVQGEEHMKDEALKQKLGMEQRNRGSVGFQEALAQPEQDNTYGYASRLATAIWQKHYMKESPKFALLDTTEGVLTQIDNMTCGLVREKPAQPEPYDQTALELCNVCGWKTLIPDDACLNCERAQPEQEPVAWNAGVAPMWPQQKEGETFSVSYTTTPQLEQEPVALVIDGVLVKSELPEKYTGHLYTTPPQRTWVNATTWRGLTYVETETLIHRFKGDSWTLIEEVSARLEKRNT